ncbi:MAG: hypothetical protein HYU78_12815 [Rhodocyclales bacterium]|nr:hypothetical protein [Rhodocyclales bacterium]
MSRLPLLALLLAACATGPTYLGRPVSEMPFRVDGGVVVTLPMTSAGALPAENAQYRIEMAGLHAALSPGQPEQSQLTWGFSFRIKQAETVESVSVERVTEAGELLPVVEDRVAAVKDGSWIGRSRPQEMTRAASPWLYQPLDSTFLFKFTIRASGKVPTVLYQPSLISRQAKAAYLAAMRRD